jgi:hypothetical protein
MENLLTFDDITLTDSYRASSYKNNLSDHIFSVLDYANENSNSVVFNNPNLKFSKALYWSSLTLFYEKNPIVQSDEQKENERLLEQKLYTVLIDNLGEFFDPNDKLLLETLDFTVSNYVDYHNYKEKLDTLNPWILTNDILINDHLLYSFTDDVNDYKILNRKESELSKYLTIGVLGKGYKKDYAHSYIKDIYGLRAMFINLLDELNHDCYNPIKINEVIKKFRELEISKEDLSDNNIKNWIVKPLKKSIKIGSNKNGYFLIRTEEDLYESYISHFNNFMGFIKTLDKHQRISKSFKELENNFNLHRDILVK